MDFVANNLLVRVILQDTEDQFMMKVNILAENVAKNLPGRMFLQNTEEQFLEESIHLAYNVAKKIYSNVLSESQC